MRDDHERVLDIIEAIERIEKVSGRGKNFFYEDEMAQVWIIHHLQILGEAARGVFSGIPGGSYRYPLVGHYRDEKYPHPPLFWN